MVCAYSIGPPISKMGTYHAYPGKSIFVLCRTRQTQSGNAYQKMHLGVLFQDVKQYYTHSGSIWALYFVKRTLREQREPKHCPLGTVWKTVPFLVKKVPKQWQSGKLTPSKRAPFSETVPLGHHFPQKGRQNQCPFAKGHQSGAPKGNVLHIIKGIIKGCPKGTISVPPIFLSVLFSHTICGSPPGVNDG